MSYAVISDLGQAKLMPLVAQKMLHRPTTAAAAALARITGVVVDAAGTPVAGATFTVNGVPIATGTAVSKKNPGGLVPYATDASGTFTIGRNAGVYDVTISAEGYPPVTLKALKFEAGVLLDLGPISLSTGETKTGNGLPPAATGRWWKLAAWIGGGVAVASILSFVGYKLFTRGKKTPPAAGW